jgi:hypothetical protein
MSSPIREETSNPVRLYVLHHPASDGAQILRDYVYDWFRLPSLEGIPVYLRSAAPPGKQVPLPPNDGKGVLEYLIPLIDANLVRDVAWHDYLEDLAKRCLKPSMNGPPPTEGSVMFPVAMDGTAFNLPALIGQRNFIRHPPLPEGLTSEEQKSAAIKAAAQQTLKHLTEALARDLNARLFPKQVGQKLNIFISYARADGTEAPKKLRDYIQGQTQCSAFLDENDIGFGESFGNVLEEGVGGKARALIVVGGDHYAERPWCRWEIGRFMKPDQVLLDPEDEKGGYIQVYHPVIVLNTMDGHRMTRVIPELGHVPSMRWAPGKEMLAFSALMREVFFGARNVLVARSCAKARPFHPGPVVNRLPGPVVLQRLLNQPSYRLTNGRDCIHVSYPGNGLPLMELHLLEEIFQKVRLTAFRDVERNLPEPMQKALAARRRALDRKVLAVSFSVSPELAELGYMSQHLEEAIIYLLRPLLRLGVDLLYGGLPPKRYNPDQSTITPGSAARRNMTLTLMHLLNDERSAGETINETGETIARACPSRLYNPSAWPVSDSVTPEDEAAWINTCSIVRVLPEHAGLTRPLPDEKREPRRYLTFRAVVLSHMRRMLAQGFKCPVPGDLQRDVKPAAFVFMGGKTTDFYGIMPGIMEEFFRAVEQKLPIYLVGGLGGAAGVIADALTSETRTKPPTFTAAFYGKGRSANYQRLLEGFRGMKANNLSSPSEALGELWKIVQEGRKDGVSKLLRNGLNVQENRELMTTTDTLRAVHLVWEGLSRLFLQQTSSDRIAKNK